MQRLTSVVLDDDNVIVVRSFQLVHGRGQRCHDGNFACCHHAVVYGHGQWRGNDASEVLEVVVIVMLFVVMVGDRGEVPTCLGIIIGAVR